MDDGYVIADSRGQRGWGRERLASATTHFGFDGREEFTNHHHHSSSDC